MRCWRALIVVLSLGLSTLAWSWGSEGHRITGLIAQSQLTPIARANLRKIIPNADLAELSVFMDVYREALKREIPGSDRWHYDNRPICRTESPAQYCADGHCASAKIPAFVRVIADEKASIEDRAQAIKFVLHMIADTHQPLHVADDDDWGGNKKMALLPAAEMPRNLHFIWDIEFVKLAMAGKSETELALEWTTRFAMPAIAWRLGTNDDWMRESEGLGRRLVYGSLPGFACGMREQDGTLRQAALFDGKPWGEQVRSLDEAYVTRAVAEIPALITRAGVRIAAVLNRALGGPTDQR